VALAESFGGPTIRAASREHVESDKDSRVHFRLELILLPVSDVDRAKAFYEQAGFKVDVDFSPNESFRVVQLTPPGSSCSITIGVGLTDAAPGSTRGTHLMVNDIEAARDELVGRGIDVGDVQHMRDGQWQPGPHPQRGDYESFAHFSDPDGNTWVLQERDYSTPA
jgi:predicted lactoylglutathione lyase